MIQSFEEILEFEKKSNIFFVKNDNGIYLWDIFRYYVVSELRYGRNKPLVKQARPNSIRQLIKLIVTSFRPWWLLYVSKKKYDNLFFFSSRNQYKDSFIDQNAFEAYNTFRNEKNYIVETWSRRKYKYYSEYIYYRAYLENVCKEFTKVTDSDKGCVHSIYELLVNYFGNLTFSETDLCSLLEVFYRDAFLYGMLLKRHNIKRVFLTQNGIQKGLFYAAKQLGIPLYEFQHGIIGKCHPSYSYPDIKNIQDAIYMSFKYLTLSDYWCKSFFLPMKNVSIGNNYFCKPVYKKADADKILVISADLFGKDLAKIIKDAVLVGKINADDVVFKLHPNQYFEKAYFIDYFENRVSVLTDEKSVNELLSESKCMITVCSTAAYEALQAGIRVLVYAISMYKEMELLFDDENLFLFNNIEELERGIESELSKDYIPPVFFEKCTPEKIKTAIDE